MRRIFFKLFTQTVYVYRHCRRVSGTFAVPYPVIQLLAVKNNISISHEKKQQLVFFVLEFHFFSVKIYAVCLRIQDKSAYVKFFMFCGCSPEPFVLCKMSFDPRYKNAWGKRLCNVVVGSFSKSSYFVGVFTPCGYHEYGDIGFFTELSADGKTVHAGEHHIEQNEAVAAGKSFCQSCRPVGCDIRCES